MQAPTPSTSHLALVCFVCDRLANSGARTGLRVCIDARTIMSQQALHDPPPTPTTPRGVAAVPCLRLSCRTRLWEASRSLGAELPTLCLATYLALPTRGRWRNRLYCDVHNAATPPPRHGHAGGRDPLVVRLGNEDVLKDGFYKAAPPHSVIRKASLSVSSRAVSGSSRTLLQEGVKHCGGDT